MNLRKVFSCWTWKLSSLFIQRHLNTLQTIRAPISLESRNKFVHEKARSTNCLHIDSHHFVNCNSKLIQLSCTKCCAFCVLSNSRGKLSNETEDDMKKVSPRFFFFSKKSRNLSSKEIFHKLESEIVFLSCFIFRGRAKWWLIDLLKER